MIYLWFIMWVCINSSYAQQYYDPSDCSADTGHPGSRYTCSSSQHSCKTFLVYRATNHFQSLSEICNLFHMDSGELLQWNNNITSASDKLNPGKEVIVPINCSCVGRFYQASFTYIIPEITTLSEIACGVFESLLKSHTLAEENPSQENGVKVGFKLNVPLRCACPDDFAIRNRVKYLLTYPFVEGDGTIILSEKFGISPVDLWAANNLEPKPTVYPNTTVLVPLKSEPVIDFNIPDPQPSSPGFLPTITVKDEGKDIKLRNLYIAGSIVGFFLVAVVFLALVLYLKATRRWRVQNLPSFNNRSSTFSHSTTRSSPRSGQITGRSSAISYLSPDLLVGIKYSLKNYSVEDIKRAAADFSEETKIDDQVYKGLIDNVKVMIKQIRFEDTRQVIDVHSKINHKNIVNLHGVCYGENDFSWCYLVLELPSNGCLRDCLSNSSSPLHWPTRTQIAFDIAMGLHYLHCCIFPSYAHLSVNSRNIFITSNWRAKLANIETNHALGSSKRNENAVSIERWVAPEYLLYGSASEKVDIFAFGVVLLELISARGDMDRKLFKDSIGFLGGGVSEGGCFEQLRSFIDPCLRQEYSLAEALCLAVLAKACVEDEPQHRPSTDDIIKVLARMV